MWRKRVELEWSSWKLANVSSGCYTVLENLTVVLLV